MNSSLQIQKLLAFSEEFDEFNELDILIESPFVCETLEGEAVKQVFLGLSPIMLLVAEQRLVDYKMYPDVLYYRNAVDPEMEGLELIKVLPLSKIKLRCMKQYNITVTSAHKPTMYFELCNTRLSTKMLDKVWAEWTNLINKISRGIPLVTKHRPPEQKRTPIYTLYTSDEGVESHREIGGGSSFQHFQQVIKSYDTLSRYRGLSYNESISETYSVLNTDTLEDESFQQPLVEDNLSNNTPTKDEMETSACSLVEDSGNNDLIDSQGDQTKCLNVNNAANSDQFPEHQKISKSEIYITDAKVRVSAPKIGRHNSKEKAVSSGTLFAKQSKHLHSIYDSPPVPIKSSHVEDSAVHKHTDLPVKGRQFVRSSSIMVKVGGKEVSALDISKSKGHISRGEDELRQASHRSSLNVFGSHEKHKTSVVKHESNISTESVEKTWTARGTKKDKPKPMKSETKHKSTHEIMKKKFGPYSDHIKSPLDNILQGHTNQSKSSSSNAEQRRTNENEITHIDHVSLQLTDHPSYTLDEDKLPSEGPKINKLRALDTPPVVKPKVVSSDVDSDKAKAQPVNTVTEASYSQVIDLSRALPVPQTQLEQWSTFVQEPANHPDAPIPPFSYVYYNPQAEHMLDHVYWSMTNNANHNPFASVMINDETITTEGLTNPSQHDSSSERDRTVGGKGNSYSVVSSDKDAVFIPTDPTVPLLPLHLDASVKTRMTNTVIPSAESVDMMEDKVSQWLGSQDSSTRDYPPTLRDDTSTSALLRGDSDDEDATDLAFPHLNYTKGIPSWLSKHLAPKPKHSISAFHDELVDINSRPVWLSAKQKSLFDQLEILKSLDDNLTFDTYECWSGSSSETSPPLQEIITPSHSVPVSFIDQVIEEVCEELKGQTSAANTKPTKRKRWDILKSLRGLKQSHHVVKGIGSREMVERQPLGSVLTTKTIHLLHSLYLSCVRETCRWNMCAGDCVSPSASLQAHQADQHIFSNPDNRSRPDTTSTGVVQQTTISFTRSHDAEEKVNCNNNAHNSETKHAKQENSSSGFRAFMKKKPSNNVVVLKELGPIDLFTQPVDVPMQELNVGIQSHLQGEDNSRVEVERNSMSDSVLLHYTAQDIAREITLIDRGLFIKLNYNELISSINKASDHMILSEYQPLFVIIKLADRFHNFFTTEILKCSDRSVQIQVLQQVIMVGDTSLKLHNYNCLWAIVGALTSHPIRRLNYLWTGLRKKHSNSFKCWEKLLKLTDSKSNFKRYHECMRKAIKCMESKPHIPYMGIFLQEVLQTRCTDGQQMEANLDYDLSTDVKSCDLTFAAESLKQEVAAYNSSQSCYSQLFSRYKVKIEAEDSGALSTPMLTYEEKKARETERRQLLIHQLSTVHYDFSSNTTLRANLLQDPYNCKLVNYVRSLEEQPIA